jgi:hypothetical protein
MFSKLNQYYQAQVGSITFQLIVEPETLEGLWIEKLLNSDAIYYSSIY